MCINTNRCGKCFIKSGGRNSAAQNQPNVLACAAGGQLGYLRTPMLGQECGEAAELNSTKPWCLKKTLLIPHKIHAEYRNSATAHAPGIIEGELWVNELFQTGALSIRGFGTLLRGTSAVLWKCHLYCYQPAFQFLASNPSSPSPVPYWLSHCSKYGQIL